MTLIDLNLLLYAINSDSPPHLPAKKWIEEILSGDELVAIPWVVVLGFLRISTNPRIVERALTPAQAMDIVSGWLSRPCVRVLNPSDRHWAVLRDLLADSGTAGNLTTDAHLAALAIENGCELCSSDGDFARFKRLRWRNPLVKS
jgi:toxin-antitoxin system PIN domain toxin